MFNTQLYQEICPGCGAAIDRRNLQQLISHFNFNMNQGIYECQPAGEKINKDVASHEAHIFDLVSEEAGSH